MIGNTGIKYPNHATGNLTGIKINGKYGLMDDSFNFIVPFIYDEIKYIRRVPECIMVKGDGYKWGFIDISGK